MVLVAGDFGGADHLHSPQDQVHEVVARAQTDTEEKAVRKVGWRWVIEVKNLTFSYNKDKQALHGLDFTVEDGEIFGFLGPNGSGKSTTQKILTGILKGHGGKVSLFGQDISSAHDPEFFEKIGVLFESLSRSS